MKYRKEERIKISLPNGKTINIHNVYDVEEKAEATRYGFMNVKRFTKVRSYKWQD